MADSYYSSSKRISLSTTIWIAWSLIQFSKARPSNWLESIINRSISQESKEHMLWLKTLRSQWRISSCNAIWLKWFHLISTMWKRTTFLRSQMSPQWHSRLVFSNTINTMDLNKVRMTTRHLPTSRILIIMLTVREACLSTSPSTSSSNSCNRSNSQAHSISSRCST